MLLDIYVRHRAGVGVPVAAHGFTRSPVHVRQPIQAAPGQHPVHLEGARPEVNSELDRAQTLLSRNDTMRFVIAG